MPSSSKRAQRRAAERAKKQQPQQTDASRSVVATADAPAPPAPPAPPKAPARPAPSRRREPRQRRQWRVSTPAVVFAGATAMFAFIWWLGITQRAYLADVGNRALRQSGIRLEVAVPPDSGATGVLLEIALALGVAGGMYLLCLWALRRGFKHSFLAAILGCVAVTAAVLPVMPLTSPDAVHLSADVRTLYLHQKYPARRSGAPDKIDDPIAKQVVAFPDQPSSYGPLAYAIGGAAIPFGGGDASLRGTLFGTKLVSGVFLLLTAIFAGIAAKRLGRNGALAVAMVGMNPLFLWEFPGDGHNDTIMAAFGVLALIFLIEPTWRRRFPGFVAGLASLLSKFALIIGFPVLLAYWTSPTRTVRVPGVSRDDGGAWRPGLVRISWRTALGLTAIFLGCFGVIALMTGFFGASRGVAGPLAGITNNTPWSVLLDATTTTGVGRKTVLGFCYGGAVVTIGLIMIRHPLRTPLDAASGVALALGLFLFCFAPTLRQWYQIWAFPFIAIAGRRWLVAGGIAFSIMAFATILAANWQGEIREDFGIGDPLNTAVVVVWLVTVATALVCWWIDSGRARAEAMAEARASRRRVQRPIRSRA